jgi:uncharacterized protein (DUF488 family)
MTLPAIVTIGVYGFTEKGFFDALQAAGVDLLCDLRRRRAVRGTHYAFANSARLQAQLAERGILYRHILALAPDIALVKQLHADFNHLPKRQRDRLNTRYIDAYTERYLSHFDARDFIESLGPATTVALFCVETTPQACHRGLISDRLEADLGIHIRHLLPPLSPGQTTIMSSCGAT